MNPYYSNWNYGTTLMPSSDQSRGAYQTYENSASDPNQYYYQNMVKKEPGDMKKFISSSSNLKRETDSSAAGPSIGPVKPEPRTLQQPSKDLDPNTAISQVHELAIANRLVERYDTLEKPTPGTTENKKYFVLKLFIGAETYEGKGENIKGAKQQAALMCLQNTKYRTSKEQKLTMFKTADRTGITATSELHNIAAQKKIQIDFKFLEPFNFEYKSSMKMWSRKEMLGNYRVQLNVGGYEFYGQAELPQQAKHNAATQALEVIRKMPTDKGEAKVVAKPGITSEELNEASTSEVPSAGKNVIMLLHEVAIAHSITPEWNLIAETGPPHAKVFTTELKLGDFVTIGTGANKKTARQNAADQMWANLPDDWKKKAKQSMHRKNKSGNFRNGHILGKRRFGEKFGEFGPQESKKITTPGAIEITSNNPISSLFEFAVKKKIPPPTFTVVNETVIGQGNLNNRNQTTFKKIEFTIQCEIAGKKFIASGLNKKGIKTAAAMEAWDTIKRENNL